VVAEAINMNRVTPRRWGPVATGGFPPPE